MRIGAVSDTHGYIDPRLATALAGVDAIIHAGDVGGLHVLDALRELTPEVYAVRGNNDDKIGGLGLPSHVDLTLGGVRFHIVHQRSSALPEAGTNVIVFGHSHVTLIERRGDVLHVNPGAAGRAGFHRVQTVALLDVRDGAVEACIVELGAREPRRVAGTRGARTGR